ITDPYEVLPGDLVSLNGGATVYYVMAGGSSRLVRPEVFVEWAFKRSMVRNLSASQARQIAITEGDLYFPNGTLIKGSTSAVYVVSDSQKRPIVSGADFTGLLYQWEDIVRTSDFEVNRIPAGASIRASR
ncbi:MAG: hypothetical protein U1C18_01660, partial [Patescibacteria group bacterium]|nr:hypothetical protein [Patescibacteria group bacterium]